ncbi:MAG: MCE family protein [Desulfobacterales bacterium]|nr:MCE family protein [Desulfobacterales bacterium]
MATLKTKFSVGLFLIVGVAVIVVGIVWLGLSNYLEKGHFFVAYFDESVQGLDKDSPVKYRGVHIGRVQQIGVAPDERLIEVVMKIEGELQPQKADDVIVAQLKSVGITGLMFIELERKKNSERLIYPPTDFTPPHPVLPTRPSEISKLFKGIEDVFAIFRSLDTQTISNELVAALKKINRSIDDAKLDQMAGDLQVTLKNVQKLVASEKTDRLMRSFEQTSVSLNQMAVNADGGISDIRDTVNRLEKVIDSSGGDLQQVTADLKESTQQLKRAMETAALLLENTDRKVDSMQGEILVTLDRIEKAGDTLNRFLDRVANDPSQIVFGGPTVEKPAAP